jgi:hypothetical protein
LTYPSDKLAALAGLATHFEAAGAGTYLYGLWLEAFDTQLLWANQGFSPQEYRPRIAPSWSWISAADGGIDWGRTRLLKSRWQIISVPMHDVATENENQEPILFPLEVSGNLAQLSLELRDGSDVQEAFPGFRSVNLKLASANDLLIKTVTSETKVAASLSSIEHNSPMALQNFRGEIWTDYKFWTDETSLWNCLSNIYFWETGIEDQAEAFGPHCWAVGMLLRCVDADKNATVSSFERIGWLRFCTNTTKDKWTPLGTDTTFFFV